MCISSLSVQETAIDTTCYISGLLLQSLQGDMRQMYLCRYVLKLSILQAQQSQYSLRRNVIKIVV